RPVRPALPGRRLHLHPGAGRRPAHRDGRALLAVPVRERPDDPAPVGDRREHPPPGRGGLQGRGPCPAPGAAPGGVRAAVDQGSAVNPKVALVDSGGANIGSLRYALERVGADARLTADPATVRAADRVILPGVGAAGEGMRRLGDRDLVDVLRELEQPVLGVCLGMQLLFEGTDEDGGVECLGLLPGRVVAIPGTRSERVPHMGWNTLVPLRDDPLTEGIAPGARAYFVHGYGVPVTEDT